MFSPPFLSFWEWRLIAVSSFPLPHLEIDIHMASQKDLASLFLVSLLELSINVLYYASTFVSLYKKNCFSSKCINWNMQWYQENTNRKVINNITTILMIKKKTSIRYYYANHLSYNILIVWYKKYMLLYQRIKKPTTPFTPWI